MKITILGGGPAGLYCGLLLKKASPAHEVRLVERNAPDATYGWGVVFSDRTLSAFQEADYTSYKAITNRFVSWDAIDTWYRGERIHCGGHVFAGLARKALLSVLQARCRELGVMLEFSTEAANLEALGDADLIIGADGVNSLARKTYETVFQPVIKPGRAKYIWFGMDRTLDAFTFIFKESAHGLFQVHSYPFSGETSTFIVECAEDVWLRAGLDQASEEESIAYCERLFAEELRGARLLSNKSSWISFGTLKCAHWHTGNVVLLGDAVHTAHFSIGSGTKLAMEDAIALANAIEVYPDLERALGEYELARRPVVELFQNAAAESQAYFENVKRYTALPTPHFVFNLLTRSKRVTYDDLRLRDPRFSDWVDRSVAALAAEPVEGNTASPTFVPPPAFAGMRLAGAWLRNRVALRLRDVDGGEEAGSSGAALVLTPPIAISPEARVTSCDARLWAAEDAVGWEGRLARWRAGGALVCATLTHAGRRGATRPLGGGADGATIPDQPLREGAWELVAASAIPYTARSQTPRALDREGMRAIREAFTRAARLADTCDFDLLQLDMAHGRLLAGFLSPLSNQRTDRYGGTLENRMRFPLDVLDAARAVWPTGKPLAVALNCHDGARGGLALDEAAVIARALREHGCDLIEPLAGQTVPNADLPYGRGFLTPLSERIRLEAGVATLAGGYLTEMDGANTILAGGRGDLVVMTPRDATPAAR